MAGSFEVGKEFTITAYVDDPLESQALTLELPAGLDMVAGQGKATQAVPPPDDTGHAVIVWKARVGKLGSHDIKIRSSNGIEYKTKLTIEKTAKAAATRGQLLPELAASVVNRCLQEREDCPHVSELLLFPGSLISRH
jgi:hypothetical protein